MRGPCRSSSGASSACRQRCCVWDGAVVRSAEHRAGPLHANLYVPPLAVERPDACRFEEQASHQYWPVDASYGDSFRASLPAWAEPYSLRASLCARDHGTRADRSIDPCTWIHRSPRVPPSRAGLYPCKCGDRSIDPRTSIGATRLSLDASPHLDPSIPACLSMEVRLSLQPRPLIPVVQAGIDGSIPADPSMQVCASLLPLRQDRCRLSETRPRGRVGLGNDRVQRRFSSTDGGENDGPERAVGERAGAGGGHHAADPVAVVARGGYRRGRVQEERSVEHT